MSDKTSISLGTMNDHVFLLHMDADTRELKHQLLLCQRSVEDIDVVIAALNKLKEEIETKSKPVLH